MTNEDRSVWIVFNGEIYNHRELRRDLEARGHRFRTHSDTEAIVHAYEEYGDALRRSPRRHVRVCDRRPRTAPRAAGARSPRQEAALLRHPRRRAALRQRDQGDQGQPGCGMARSISTRSKAICRSAISWRRPPSIATSASSSPATLLGSTAACHRSASTGTSSVSTPTRAPRAECWTSSMRGWRRRSRNGSRAKCRSARSCRAASIRGWSSRTWPKRSAQPPVTTSVGFDDAAHNELAAAGLTAVATRTRHHTAVVEPQPRRRARSDRRGVRRAVRRPVGDSDLLRQQDGARST